MSRKKNRKKVTGGATGKSPSVRSTARPSVHSSDPKKDELERNKVITDGLKQLFEPAEVKRTNKTLVKKAVTNGRIEIQLPDELKKRIETKALREMCSVSALIRRVMNEYVSRY